MGLTKDQMASVTSYYEQKRMDNRMELDRRKDEVYKKAPLIKEYNDTIASLAADAAKKSLMGDKNASKDLKSNMDIISQKYGAALLSAGYPINYLDDIYDCQICHDTGFVNGKPCKCLKNKLTDILNSASKLTGVITSQNFNTFDFDFYSDSVIDPATGKSALENIQTVVNYCRHFIDTFSSSFQNILFYGSAGTGKTFLANCVANELISRSFSVIYLSAVKLTDLLSDFSFRKDNANRSYNGIFMDDLLKCDLLVIDDLGAEMRNSYTDSALFDCLDYRLTHQKSTLISTNLLLEEIKNSYSERVFSRIFGEYTCFKFFGEDIRLKKNT